MAKSFVVCSIMLLLSYSAFSQNNENINSANSVSEFSFRQIIDPDALVLMEGSETDINSLRMQKLPDVIITGIHAGIGFCELPGYHSHYESSEFSYFLSARFMYLFADSGRLGISAGFSWVRNGFDETPSSYHYYTNYPKYYIRMDNLSISLLFSGLYSRVYFGAGPYAAYSIYSKNSTAELVRPELNKIDFGLEIEAGYFHPMSENFSFMFGINFRAGIRTVVHIGDQKINNFSFHAIVGFMYNNTARVDKIVKNNLIVRTRDKQSERERARKRILVNYNADIVPVDLLTVKTDMLGTRYYFKGVELEQSYVEAALDALSTGLSSLVLEAGNFSRRAIEIYSAAITLIPFTGYAISDDNLSEARSNSEIAVELLNQALIRSADVRKKIYPSLLVLHEEKLLQIKNEQDAAYSFLGFRIGGGGTFIANVEGIYQSFQFGIRYMNFFPLKNTYVKLGLIADAMIHTCGQHEVKGNIIYFGANLMMAMKYKRLYLGAGGNISILLNKNIPDSLYLNDRTMFAFTFEPGLEILKSPKLLVGMNLKIYFKNKPYTVYDGSVKLEKTALPYSISAHISVGF